MKKNVVEKEIQHEQYKEALFEQLWLGMNILRSEGHEIYGMHVNKVTKRWIADDGVHTLAYGHRDIDVFGGTTNSSSRTKPRLSPALLVLPSNSPG